MAGLGTIWKACRHPDGMGRVMRTFRARGHSEVEMSPLGQARERELAGLEQRSVQGALGWDRVDPDYCRL